MNKTIREIEIVDNTAEVKYSDKTTETIILKQPTKLLYKRAKEQLEKLNMIESKCRKKTKSLIISFLILLGSLLLLPNISLITLVDDLYYIPIFAMSLIAFSTAVMGDNLSHIEKQRNSLTKNVEKIMTQFEKIQIRKISPDFFRGIDLTFKENSYENLDFSSKLLVELSDKVVEEIKKYNFTMMNEEIEKEKAFVKRKNR